MILVMGVAGKTGLAVSRRCLPEGRLFADWYAIRDRYRPSKHLVCTRW